MKNVVDKIYGRKISEEHMVSLIAWNENDFNVIGLEETVECVKNDLEHYMKKHEYEYIDKGGCKMKSTQLTKEDVRQLAIDFQMNWDDMSLLELCDARDGFEYLGKIYGLTEEFIEEGIL